MKCTEPNCTGDINELTCADLVGAKDIAHPCRTCGRMHWSTDGKPAFDKHQHAMFMDEEGRVVDRRGKVTSVR